MFGAQRVEPVTLLRLIYRGANTGGKTKIEQLTPNYGFFPLNCNVKHVF